VETLETAKRGRLTSDRRYDGSGESRLLPHGCPALSEDPACSGAGSQGERHRSPAELRAAWQGGLGETRPVRPCPPVQEGEKADPQTPNLSGRVIWDIQRKCHVPDEDLSRLLILARRIFSQKRNDHNKFTVFTLGRWNASPKARPASYEFGCKVAMFTSSIRNWVLAIDALHGNPFDGHTMKQSLDQVKRIIGWQPLHAYCDRGYWGAGKEITDTTVHLAGKKKRSMKPGIWRWYARRSAIEPIFGHLKSDHRLERNHLKGKEGDRMNAILSGCGFTPRSFLLVLFLLAAFRPERGTNLSKKRKPQPCLFQLRLIQDRLNSFMRSKGKEWWP